MKKVVSFKILLIGLLSLIIIGVTTSSFATDSVLESGNNTSTPTAISASEYQNASVIPTDNNTVNTTGTSSSTTSTTTSTGTSTNSVYNTIDEDNTNKDTIPQTGIEDGYVGILLIVFVTASIFAYKKMKDYKNI